MAVHWEEIAPSRHFEAYHKGSMAWSDVVRLIYAIKSRRKKGGKIEIEDSRVYILCEIKGNTLEVINVKIK